MTPSRSAAVGVAVLVAALLVVAGVGTVAAHGSTSVFLLVGEQAGPDVPERFRVEFGTTAADEVPAEFRDERFRVNYTTFVDDERIGGGAIEMDFRETETVRATHAFSEPGFRELAVNATFSLGGGEWTREVRSTRLVEVVEPGTEAALSECVDHAGGDLLPPYRLGCYLTHRGLAGLVPGLAASPPLLGGLLAAVLGVGAVAVRVLGVELP